MRTAWTISIALTLVLLTTGVGLAGVPTDQVQRSVDEVLKVTRSQPDSAARRAELRRMASGLFDFEETAKRAPGPHWQQRTPAERGEFVKLFTDLLLQDAARETGAGESTT